MHVTLRVTTGIASLRGSSMFRSVRGALAAGRRRFGFRLVHFSVQRNHMHLLAEARDRRALTRGMQGLAIRIAKAVNRKLARHGKVFADRYHARALKTPDQARFGLRYVLANTRKHAYGLERLPAGHVDNRSSAPWFDGWSRPRELAFVLRKRLRLASDDEVPVVQARTWLLRVGWRLAGPLDVDDRPASRDSPPVAGQLRAQRSDAGAGSAL